MTDISATITPRVRVHGLVPAFDRAYGLEKLIAALRHAPFPVVDARLTLDVDAPGHRADANVVLNGAVLHVHALGESMAEAVDLMQERLRARLRHLRRRPDQGPPPGQGP